MSVKIQLLWACHQPGRYGVDTGAVGGAQGAVGVESDLLGRGRNGSCGCGGLSPAGLRTECNVLWFLLVIIGLLIAAIIVMIVRAATMKKRPKSRPIGRQRSAIHLSNAAAKGDVETVRTGLKQGADPNEVGPEKKRPLHWAAQRGHRTIAAVLIDAGADVNAKDGHGSPPLHLTCEPSRSNELRERQFEVAELLIDHNAGVNARNNDGITPLIRAAKNERRDIVELLLSRHAAPSAKDSEGYSALFWARRGKDPSIVKMLEDARATE